MGDLGTAGRAADGATDGSNEGTAESREALRQWGFASAGRAGVGGAEGTVRTQGMPAHGHMTSQRPRPPLRNGHTHTSLQA